MARPEIRQWLFVLVGLVFGAASAVALHGFGPIG